MINLRHAFAPDWALSLATPAQILPKLAHDSAQLVLKFGVHADHAWLLSASRSTTIGRDPASDIQLPVRLVSRNHAQIRWLDGCYQLEDLGSKNGTYLNGKPVKCPTPLADGDECQIATCFKFAFVVAVAAVDD